MRIKPKFLSLIRKGIKKHEYRLNKDKYKDINIGDQIKLVSNDDENDFIVIKVKNIKVYKDFESAIDMNDFIPLYNDKETLVKECNTFYLKEDIERLGIKVFEIEY